MKLDLEIIGALRVLIVLGNRDSEIHSIVHGWEDAA